MVQISWKGAIKTQAHLFILIFDGRFDIDPNEKENFFTQAERSYVVNYILRRAGTKSDNNARKNDAKKEPAKSTIDELEKGQSVDELLDQDQIDYEHETGVRPLDQELAAADEDDVDYGIAKLLKDNVFLAAYPLHEPKPKYRLDGDKEGENVRIMLGKHWASWKRVFKEQPVDYIRLYFGEMFGFYFAWLGYYTMWLVVPTVVGIIVFLSGFIGIRSDAIV
ncbi:Anoctamin-1 [Cichlidogyrus casuarinus]|uniref:Anoctamin n=1 Tax=Cichlidogyrus casuarinus TaxID=1844966 RepID=A0ABD2Q8Q2_9PLAT